MNGMEDLNFFPLIDTDTDGTTKAPMFPVHDERSVKGRGGDYLAEYLPKVFRLRAHAGFDRNADIRCPYCGKTLRRIMSLCIPDALYRCENCHE